MMIQHTPGPWAIDPNDGWLITADCDGLVVAEIPYGDLGEESGDRHHETNEANARLIAAAPRLMQALKSMVGRFGGSATVQLDRDALREARAAIAEVTGGAA
jgi:hypothetical protein